MYLTSMYAVALRDEQFVDSLDQNLVLVLVLSTPHIGVIML